MNFCSENDGSFWTDEETHVLVNSKTDPSRQEALREMLLSLGFRSHIWLGTSGTTGTSKWIALPKSALLHSAAAVNMHLQGDARDTWLHTLPDFHVGGLGIWARSYLSGARVFRCDEKWDPERFCNHAHEQQATLSALVPTQLFDLVAMKLQAPPSMRAVIIGGGALSEALYSEAKQLGWKPLPSYGLTEFASQVATAPLASLTCEKQPYLHILSHVDVSVGDNGCLVLSGRSLFTACALVDDTQVLSLTVCHGSYETEDLGEVIGQDLVIKGRLSNVVKVGGENVDMDRLEQLLNKIIGGQRFAKDFALIAVPDARLGHSVRLAVVGGEAEQAVNLFNEQVLPYERIRGVHVVEQIPRSPLQKVLKSELLAMMTS